MAEIIKAGAIQSNALFLLLEQSADRILAKDLDLLYEVRRLTAPGLILAQLRLNTGATLIHPTRPWINPGLTLTHAASCL